MYFFLLFSFNIDPSFCRRKSLDASSLLGSGNFRVDILSDDNLRVIEFTLPVTNLPVSSFAASRMGLNDFGNDEHGCLVVLGLSDLLLAATSILVVPLPAGLMDRTAETRLRS